MKILNKNQLSFFLGPCVIESRDSTLFHAEAIKSACPVPFVFKSSYTKANRTSGDSYRGPGLEEGLKILSEVKSELGLPVITDVHTEEEAKAVSEVVDVIQIPAFLCRQTALLEAAGTSGLPVMIKKGQFLHPEDMKYAASKVGHKDVLLCERGSCFGYRNLVVDFKSFGTMSELGYPVVFDATHSVQIMGGAGGKSSGASSQVIPLARAAVSYGVDGVFIEVHKDPSQALSDGSNMLKLSELQGCVQQLIEFDKLRNEHKQT